MPVDPVVPIEALEPRRLLAANLVISEFLASNDHGLTDGGGNHADWIEIHNAGDAAANLNDYFLTDNAGDPEQWRFPAQTLAAGAYLVVFADGTTAPPVANTELHTNFKLGADGEYLGLIRAADDTPQFEYAPTFPAQSSDVSYGLFDANDPASARIFFTTPTPGAANAPVAAATSFSVPGKMFINSLNVSLASTTPNAVIHYTLDGTVPTASSPTYSSPLVITNTTMLRTIVFASGYGSSPVASQSYIALNSTANSTTTLGSPTVSSFSSNLPIVMIDTFGTPISDTSDNAASASFIDTTGGVAHALDTPNYDGRLGFRIRGSTSENYDKKQYSLELWDESNNDKKVSLLGMPAESDWVLYAPYTEKSLMQNALAYQWANETGHWASHTRFVEVFLNTSAVTSGGVAAPTAAADYLGVYILEEKIKVSDSRVKLDEISPTNPNGGWMIVQDRNDAGTESSFFTSGYGVRMINSDPDVHSITPTEKTTISNGWNAFETALRAGDFADPNAADYYGNFIDVRSFVDYFLLNEMTRNIDSFWLSTYYTKSADTMVGGQVTQRGLISAGPAWDFNLALGMANYNQSANAAGWDTDLLSPKSPTFPASFPQQDPYFQRLLTDPNFVQAISDRWADLRSTVFSTPRLMSDIDANVALLANGTTNYPVGTHPAQAATNAVVRNFIRWPELGTYVVTEGLYDPNGNWLNEIGLAKGWLTARVNWMDSQFVPRPIVTPPGGNYGSAVNVSMSPIGAATFTDTTLLAEGSPVRWFVPSSAIPATGWYLPGYTYPTSPTLAVWGSGNGGVGYDAQPSPVDFNPFIGAGSNVQTKMQGINPTLYTRWTFNLADPSSIGALILKIRYDDGFIAWVNGVRVMDINSPENINPTFSTATAGASSGDDNLAITLREFDISAVKSLLVAGTNTLAIQCLNSGSGSADALVSPVLVSRQVSYPAGGTIYYTTDGSDPRTPSGAISPTAILYSGAFSVGTNTRIRARTLTGGGVWSALADNVYVFDADALRVSELMYNPPAGAGFATQDFEFIEVKNISASPLNLKGYTVSDGIVFTFPDVTLAPGAFGVIAHDSAAFQSRYGSGPGINLLGQFISGSLDNGGESVALSNGFGQVVQSFIYDNAWYPSTDGGGYSLVIRDPSGPPANWNTASGWRASYAPLGLPGQDDADTVPPVLQSTDYDPPTSRVRFFFSEPISLASATGITVIETLSGNPITPASITASGNVATITLPAGMGNGIYAVALPAADIIDAASNHPLAGGAFTFAFVAAGATLALPAGGTTYTVDQLAIASGAALDVKDDSLIVRHGDIGSWNGSACTGITGLLASGRNGGSWNGAGIVSSLATGLTSLAVAPNGADALVKYTYGGDANEDGKLNVDDYGAIDFNVTLPGVSGWVNGDFNYDGKINVDDYGIIDFNVGIQGPPLAGVATPMALAFGASTRPPIRWNPFTTPEKRDNPLPIDLL